jgi:L-asparaginase II
MKKDDMELPQVRYTKMTAKKGAEGVSCLDDKGEGEGEGETEVASGAAAVTAGLGEPKDIT